MKLIRKRQDSFASNFAEPASQTYGNAEQSAIKAGYSPRYARGKAYTLVAKDGIKKRIAEIQKRVIEHAEKDKQEKLYIAWNNYIKAIEENRDRDAQKWFREHGDLRGDYVIKVEGKQETVITTDEQQSIHRAILRARGLN